MSTPTGVIFVQNFLEVSVAAALQRRCASTSTKPPQVDRRKELFMSLERELNRASDKTVAGLLELC